MSRRLTGAVVLGLVMTAAGCDNALDVKNENDPETERVLATASDVEALIRDAFLQAKRPLLSAEGINMQLASVAFENSAMAANFGMIERSAFPRGAIINTASSQFAAEYFDTWGGEYGAIRAVSDALTRIEEGLTLGNPVNDARMQAFGKFVLGFAHAVLAITYDQASIYDETDPIPSSTVPPKPLVPYTEVMEAALGYMDEAIEIAEANPSMSFPADWMGVPVSQSRFIQIVNSFKARYRTQVARTPVERDQVDWNAVIDEVDAGITTDYAVVDDDDRWDFWMHDYTSFQGPWAQVPYFISGMADTSGAYETWMATPIGERTAFVIASPDRRFPRGATLEVQSQTNVDEEFINAGSQIRAKSNATGEGGWTNSERGTWRWSHYLDERFLDYYIASNTGVAIPVITVTEMDLLKAEAYIRTDQPALALPLINKTRVDEGGLPPATLLGAQGQGNACVPQLPNGSCGDLLETLKWEKRRSQFMTVFGGWYFDSRGWGDLPLGTFLHYPVPARELEVRELPLYTFGGGGTGSAPLGTYGY
jgi:hypothetical protein